MSNTKKKVFVAMSGGVDSSVAAALLKEQGYDVHGVFMQGWSNPHFACTWRSDRQDAARVAATLGIPFQTIDYSRKYYERVVSSMLEEYRAGRTPNPDVMCNKEIKFGLFYRWAMERGADFIATGHYSRKSEIRNQKSETNSKLPAANYQLQTARDSAKDQTYFLWTLAPEIIARTLFPIGDYTKSEVRELARKFGLHTADKKDSQGLCFVGSPAGGRNFADFLRDYIQTRRGTVITADGRKIGEHDGVELFTIGQRHGIGVGGQQKPLYVAEKNAVTNTLIVASGRDDPILYRGELIAEHVNWISGNPPEFPLQCFARIRYRQPLQKAIVTLPPNPLSLPRRRRRVEAGLQKRGGKKRDTYLSFGGEVKVSFNEPQRAVAPGQSIVFYRGEEMVGGGVIAP